MGLVFLLASVITAMAGGTGGQGFAGSFSQGNGQGFGYGGSFGSSSGGGGGGGSLPSRGNFGPGDGGGAFPPGVPPFDFNSFLNQYFEVFQKFNQDLAATKLSAYAYSITNADSNSRVQAQSSLTFDKKGLQNQQNAFAAGGYGFPGGYPAYANGGYGGGFSSSGGQGAFASGSIGPGGTHQTAHVYPENPSSPNVDNRFGSSSGEGTYGVFTSSQSGSANINGKPTSYHQASTTINDNGKVTHYTVHNP